MARPKLACWFILALGSSLSAACTAEVGEIAADDPSPEKIEASLTLGLQSIMTHAKNAGVPCSRLVLAGAVAMAESGGLVEATNWNPASGDCPYGSTDRGLWQINDCYWDNYSDACCFDPACNAKAMAQISNYGQSFQLWSAYTNGSYEKYLSQAQAAYDAGISGCSGGSGTTPKPSSSCSALGYQGTCAGDTSIWWENGSCKLRDCASEGRQCGLISASIGYGCLGGTSGATTKSCASLGYTGRCTADDTLVWYENGQCRWEHCPASGRSCGWDGANGYNCL